MKKKEFKVYTREVSKSVPANMIIIKDERGWLYLQNENTNWFVNHTNTFNKESEESDEEVIKAIVKQIKLNKKLLEEPNEDK